MVASNRTRSRSGVGERGTYVYRANGSITYSNFPTQFTQTTTDVVGNYLGNNYFLSDVVELKSDGRINTTTGLYIFQNVPGSYMSFVPGFYPQPSSSGYATQILSRTGLNTPRVNLPLFMYELKDIPRMLKDAGDMLHKLWNKPHGLLTPSQAASATLAYQFGWKPLIEDLYKLSNFSDHIDKRQKEMIAARSKRGLKRRTPLFFDQRTLTGKSPVHSSYGLLVEPRWTEVQEIEQYGYVRWKERTPYGLLGAAPTWNSAMRSALGLNLGMIPIDVWKALPWSWCIDWFANISDVLQANYNTIYYVPSNMGVTTKRTTTRSWMQYPENNPNPWVGKQVTSRLIKKREVLTPTVSFNLKLPFMDSFKTSILGSLAILKIKGSSRT